MELMSLVFLSSNMVKLKNDRIIFSAVYAWVFKQELIKSLPEL